MQLFVDESKKRGHHFAVAAVAVADVQRERTLIKSLLLPGQSHLHFTKESDGRRRSLLRRLVECSSVRCTIVTAPPGVRDDTARQECLRKAARIADETAASRLVFERDDSTLQFDKKFLYPLLHGSEVRYDFLAKREEPLLWFADAIVWCHTAGGRWRTLSEPLVQEMRRL